MSGDLRDKALDLLLADVPRDIDAVEGDSILAAVVDGRGMDADMTLIGQRRDGGAVGRNDVMVDDGEGQRTIHDACIEVDEAELSCECGA